MLDATLGGEIETFEGTQHGVFHMAVSQGSDKGSCDSFNYRVSRLLGISGSTRACTTGWGALVGCDCG